MKKKDIDFITEAYGAVAEFAQQHQLGKGNTTVSTQDGITRVTFHQTVVVAFNAEKIILDSGGLLTATTKTRMNQASNQFEFGYQVFQQRGDWFIFYKDETVPFKDGIVLPR